MQNYIAASTHNITDRLSMIDKNQRLIATTAAEHLGPTNTSIQQVFIGVDARQATHTLSFTVVNPTEYTSDGGSSGPPPPPPPAAGAVRMIDNTQPNYIGTPRREPRERAPRGERSRSASTPRGRRTGVQRPILDIQVTPPIEATIPTIRNIGLEEIRVKRQASASRSAPDSPVKAKARGRPK